MDFSSVLDGLNEAQKQAVTAADGRVLVIAGPGTGKTLTIVRRIAWLVHQGVKPETIVAVTFTNRAAREMRERAGALLGNAAHNVFIGTLHLFGLKILRESRSADFVLFNREDQTELLKTILNIPAGKARQTAERISRAKNFIDDADEELRPLLATYTAALAQQSALDFDDLILKPIVLFSDGDVLKRCRDRFRHIIVDEYQDINPAQGRLLRLLLGDAGAIFAVGDADQAVYAFRGADVSNVLDFEKHFPGARKIALAESYRSTGAIVEASTSVIRNNRARIDKELRTARERGTRLSVVSTPDDRSEGEAIVAEIEARIGGTSHDRLRRGGGRRRSDGGCSFSDFAVIYRANAQARAIETAFLHAGIPFQIIGRQSSQQKKETEEIIAYLSSMTRPDAGGGSNDSPESKLLTEADYFDPRADAVTLTTLHAAKGLEFRFVFLAGCEDGLIPSMLMKDACDIEEERRLFYVGMTRAKDELFLLHSRSRFLYGRRLALRPSPFLSEIPDELAQKKLVADRKKNEREEDKQMGLF